MQTSGYTEPAELVLRDAGGAVDAWNTMYSGVAGNPPPAVDFARDMIVVVALGQRSTGGFTIRVDSVSTSGGGATVHYTVTTPGPSCMTTQMMTSPVDVVRVPRVEGDVRFDRRVIVQDC